MGIAVGAIGRVLPVVKHAHVLGKSLVYCLVVGPLDPFVDPPD